MLVAGLEARGFRNLGHAEVELPTGVTLIHGPNGAGKTNLLEALCFGLTAASWRTCTDRELIGFGEDLARSEVGVTDGEETRVFLASATRGDGRSQRLNGNPVPADAVTLRPAVAVFSPDRLALVKGPPTERRGTSTASSPRCGRRGRTRDGGSDARWRNATRSWDGSGPGRRQRTRWTPGTRSSPSRPRR